MEKLKRVLWITYILVLLSVTFSDTDAQQSAELFFQQGLYEEEVQGNLESAIEIYEKILNDFPENRSIAANAQLHIGFCYEKLGIKRSEQAYQRVIELYPDQPEQVAVARERLKKFQEPIVHPLMKYYLERIPFDPMTSISYDGKYLACTDWSSGNLIIKDRKSGKIRKLTDIDWSMTKEFAYHAAWSRNGNYIAYSYYRKPLFIELRVVSVQDGKNWTIYSDPELVILPQDWTADNKRILCETFNYVKKYYSHLALISFDFGDFYDFTEMGTYSRGMKFSPDGNYVTYDLRVDGHRHIYTYSFIENQAYQITQEQRGEAAHNSPIWSPDGRMILYRSERRNINDLWGVAIKDGKASGLPYIVQTNMTDAIYLLTGIDQQDLMIADQDDYQKENMYKNAARPFSEDFSSPTLDEAWTVFEWKNPNIYGYPSFGRYSLTDNPGHLRYYLDSIMVSGFPVGYVPGFSSSYYCYYPSLEISRPLYGDRWQLETKVTYSMVDGPNTRAFNLRIIFNPEKDLASSLSIERHKNLTDGNHIISFHVNNKKIAQNKNVIAPQDTFGLVDYTYYYRITRRDSMIQVDISDDYGPYKTVLTGTLPYAKYGIEQKLMISGRSWFVPAGSYADWDYIRFRPLD